MNARSNAMPGRALTGGVECRFGAPWGRSLRVCSGLASLLLLGVTAGMSALPTLGHGPLRALSCVPAVILLLAGLFTIRGYRVHPHGLRIERLLWSTPVSLAGLKTVRWDPTATRGSLRLFGNGGLFSFSGWFWNRRLGLYRLFLTDWKRAVVLELHRRAVVVSPDDPEAFTRLLGTGSGSGDLVVSRGC